MMVGCLEVHIPRIPFIRRWIDWYKSQKLQKYYSPKGKRAKNENKTIIFMADGRTRHGGLADRLCGMVSAYNYCKKNGFQFKIYFVCPYHIEDFLDIATFDWIINKEDISYNSNDAEPIYLSLYSSEYSEVDKYFNREIGHCQKKQVHLYTNARYFHNNEFSLLFAELFRPTAVLQKVLDETRKRLPEHYVSLTFRFQQLLGDFKEDGFQTLQSDEKKEKLIEECLDSVRSLYNKTNSELLVTSDSTTFLSRVAHLPHVYIIPGKMRHEDYGKDLVVDREVDLKSFVDFFMLSEADYIYIYVKKPLYHTGFPKVAALVHNKSWIATE